MRTKRNLGTRKINTGWVTETFLVIQGEQTAESVANRCTKWDKSFYDLYKNPSDIKKSIYAYWERFFHSQDIYDITCSGSCMSFSITAYDHSNGYIYYITKCYNRLYLPKEA